MSKKYAVLGAGNAGFAFAGHLGLEGFDVNIYEDPKFEDNIQTIKKNGGIYLKDYLSGFGKLNKVTTCMKEAVEDVDIVIITVPEFAQKSFFEEYIKYAKDGQIVAFFPGNYASFKFREQIEKSKKDLILVEAASIPYGARKKEPGSVNIIGWKHKLHIAALPSNKTDYVLDVLNEFNNVFISGDNVLKVSLSNPNFVMHCTAVALNAGWIETTKGDFSIYWEGMSPSVTNVILAVDNERLAVGKALGFEIMDEKGFFEFYYQITGDTLYEIIQKSENHGSSGAPSSLKDRYVSEDAPAGLTAIVSLGRKLNVPTPVCDAILTICSNLNQIDYYNIGLNTKNLGIDAMTKDEILEYVN